MKAEENILRHGISRGTHTMKSKTKYHSIKEFVKATRFSAELVVCLSVCLCLGRSGVQEVAMTR